MMQPYLEQIDMLEGHIGKLEEVTRHLDDYSKRLGKGGAFAYVSLVLLFLSLELT
jgi:hypothetical protein